MKFLAIKGYRKHQHYHKRGAPWIKLYSSVLTDPEFIQLSEVAQAQLMKLWVLASQFGHPLPNNPKLLAGKIGTTGKFHLSSMIAAGFIIPCDEIEEENASKMLAESLNSPLAEIERELEVETALQHPAAAAVESELAGMLESDADRNALTAVIARATDRSACIRALHSVLTGNDPSTPQPTVPVFCEALRDLATNGEQMRARKFRNYLDSAKARQEGASRPPSGASAAPGNTGVRPEHWKDKNAREDREEAERQLVRMRHGNIEQRRAKEDGEAWWRRMQREATAAGQNATLYGYDRLHEPADPEHAHV